jgi:cyclopropane-fatty-acyl-phospholipid synthase
MTPDKNARLLNKNARLLNAARALARDVGQSLDIDASVRLWDGSLVPLGRAVNSPLTVTIASPGSIAALARWPSLDRLIRLYAQGGIGLEGGTLIELGQKLAGEGSRRRLRTLNKLSLARSLLPFLVAGSGGPERSRGFLGNVTGHRRSRADNKDFIRFHYDVSNDFYQLFLDREMIYTCAYFTDPGHDIDQAQQDKLHMICRKLRLRPGETFLDIGCGWGGLVCHAAKYYGVKALGITLSPAQFELASKRIAGQGLEAHVTVEIRDYADLSGTFDKIASIGMYEAIGVDNIPGYLKIIHRHLAPDGLFLNHGITRRAKPRKTHFNARPEQRALQRYIFPGGELDDIGNTIALMEQAGFEVHDVEGWRWHYAQTTQLWCERLYAKRDEAVLIVGEATTRIWLAYLAACSLAFQRGSARIFQTLCSHNAKGRPPLPPTRGDLYR